MTQPDRRDDVDLALEDALELMAGGEEVELVTPPEFFRTHESSSGPSATIDTDLLGQRSDDPVPVAS